MSATDLKIVKREGIFMYLKRTARTKVAAGRTLVNAHAMVGVEYFNPT